jgi:AraC-like DNA-binding protein
MNNASQSPKRQNNMLPQTHLHVPEGFFVEHHIPDIMPQTHMHGHIEINFLATGSMVYQLPTGIVHIPANRLVLFWGQVPHRVIRVNDADSIHIAYLPLSQVVTWPLPDQLMQHLFDGLFVVSDNTSNLDSPLMARWLNDFQSNDAPRASLAIAEIQLRLRRMAVDGWSALTLDNDSVVGATSGKQTFKRKAAARKVQMMVAFMAQNYTQTLHIADIAAVAGISKGYAMTIFNAFMRRSLTQYVNELRLNHARALLMDTNDKIVGIALDSGFGSLSQFYSLFHQQFGVAPSAYRDSTRQ